MRRLLKRIVRWVAAIVLIVAGLALSVPGIPGPGILIVVAGIVVLMPESRWLRKTYIRLERRYPRVFAPIERRRARQRAARRARRRAGRRRAA